jgi:hypothetical protein
MGDVCDGDPAALQNICGFVSRELFEIFAHEDLGELSVHPAAVDRSGDIVRQGEKLLFILAFLPAGLFESIQKGVDVLSQKADFVRSFQGHSLGGSGKPALLNEGLEKGSKRMKSLDHQTVQNEEQHPKEEPPQKKKQRIVYSQSLVYQSRHVPAGGEAHQGLGIALPVAEQKVASLLPGQSLEKRVF